MSITISYNPGLNSAAWRPIKFECTSDRYASTAVSVTGVTSGTGAFARFAVASHPYLVGDVVTGTLFTGGAVAYNVKMTVTVISGAYFETDEPYVASSTGTVTRSNENFQLKAQIAVFTGTKLNISGVTNPGGGLIRVTTSTHGYAVNDIVLIEGTTSYNGTYKIVAIISATVFDVTATYVASETGTSRVGPIVGTKRVYPILVGGSPIFRFNVAGMLQTSLTPDLVDSAPANIQTPNTGAIQKFAVLFTEEYDDEDGLITSKDEKLSSFRQALRLTLQHEETQTVSAFLMGSSTQRFLTNAPSSKNIRVGEEEQLSFIANPAVTYKIAYEQYIAGVAQAVQYTAGVLILDDRGILPVNSNVFNAAHSKVIVWLVDAGNAQMSEKRTFVVDTQLYAKPVRLYFENYLGGFDAFTFTGEYTVEHSNKKTGYTRSLASGFAVRDRGINDLATYSLNPTEVFSDLLTEAQALWLRELLDSNNVFKKDIGSTVFVPVNLSDGSKLIYTTAEAKQLKIEYVKSNANIVLGN